jgi:nucleoside phosphorylase
MLGIVFTTTEEASFFVRRYTDGHIEALDEDAPLQTDDLLIAVTGKGKIKATLATERLIRNHELDAVLHTGTCTALNDDFASGTAVGASFVLEGDRVELDAPTYPRMPLECPFDVAAEGTLVSQDHASDDTEERSYWERIADVRDETGYAVAYVAAQHGVPCHIVKVVETTSADQESGAAPQENAAEEMATFLQTAVADRAGLKT